MSQILYYNHKCYNRSKICSKCLKQSCQLNKYVNVGSGCKIYDDSYSRFIPSLPGLMMMARNRNFTSGTRYCLDCLESFKG